MLLLLFLVGCLVPTTSNTILAASTDANADADAHASARAETDTDKD